MTIRILIADDHTVVRRGLRGFLELEPDLEIVGEAADGAEAVDLARRLAPDVVLMDLLMSGLDGIEATREIRRQLPAVEVLALTSVLESAKVSGAIRAGAIGYLLKTTDAAELCEAIRAAAAGKVRIAPEVAARLARDMRADERPERPTARETEVLRLVARGKANKEIARALGIDETTVKSHVHSLLAKLNVRSRTQAALYAVRVGLVPADAVGEDAR